MKLIITVFLSIFLAHPVFSQLSYEQWETEAKTNKRLLPKYGHLPKTPAEIKSDSDYVQQIMAMPKFSTRREASSHLIGLGFQYYYRPDFKTAMYRFNQAYLLDTTNTDIFWGYGAIYMALGQKDLARKQYEEGLAIDSTNTHLLTDLATYYMDQYYLINQMPESEFIKNPKIEAKHRLESAINFLNKSYWLDPKDVNTVYKLSICFWLMEDCNRAWKYYDEAVLLGGQPITEEFTRDLKDRCKKN